MKGKVNGNGNLLAFWSNPLRETKVEVTAFNVVEQQFQLFVKCLLGCFVHCPYNFFFWGWGRGLGPCGLGGNAKIVKLNIFAIHPCQCFDAVVKEIQLNKTTTATTTKRLTAVDVFPQTPSDANGPFQRRVSVSLLIPCFTIIIIIIIIIITIIIIIIFTTASTLQNSDSIDPNSTPLK